MKQGDQGTRRAGEAKEKEKRTKDQAPQKKMVLKREDPKKKTLSRNRSLSHPTHLSVIPARYPIRVANQKDKGVAVPQIVHSPIHVGFQCVPG
jgi:hypothetical protein